VYDERPRIGSACSSSGHQAASQARPEAHVTGNGDLRAAKIGVPSRKWPVVE
jgi:hypothetical protein